MIMITVLNLCPSGYLQVMISNMIVIFHIVFESMLYCLYQGSATLFKKKELPVINPNLQSTYCIKVSGDPIFYFKCLITRLCYTVLTAWDTYF